MSAVYSIFTSPHHPPVPEHLPTLIVTPHGRPQQVLYTFLHTNVNTENYLLTPAPEGDLCVAKLYPPDRSGSLRGVNGGGGASSSGHGAPTGAPSVRCEAGRGLGWRVVQTGIQNPVYKILLPNPELPGEDQPLFQVSKPNPNAPFWTLTYFAYAGHLIPPKRVEFGRISKNGPEQGGGTRLAITGRSDEEKAVWASLGPGNEDAVEWLVVCAALIVLDDEIVLAAGAKIRDRPPSPVKRTGGAMRVVGPVEMQSGVPRSASSSNLVPGAPGPSAAGSRGPSPSHGRQHQQGYPGPAPGPGPGPDPRFMPPQGHPQGPPQSQQYAAAPPPHHHPQQQQHFAPPAQQQQQQYYPQQQPHHPQPQQQHAPPPPAPAPAPSQPHPPPPPRGAFAPPPRSSSQPSGPAAHAHVQNGGAGAPVQPPPRGDSRAPSGYRAGSRPDPAHVQAQAQMPGYGAPPNLAEYGAAGGAERGGGGGAAQGQRVRGEGDGQRRLVKERHR